MFDIGFLELLICGVIALLVLGPERLPTAARTAGRWVGSARRLASQFSTELDRQLKAEELREQLKKAGDVGLDDVEKTVRDALDEAKKYEHLVVKDPSAPRPAPATPRHRPPEESTSPEPSDANPPADAAETESRPSGSSQDSAPEHRS
ncbi:MAG: Sec-independent protein translocase protein TatB [Marinobacter sp.]|uniref:Sec-independent protein translocase protein TatB n=1 Tax=Marinobacter sp. TaxID=50741 RepID=UPI00299D6969|nr:Sec-independent protein translocase protein TatB [Marinobacter sp.]MDX1756839.1 Sec-independent protein translocase protein TatB [Marinobacter sp.]